MISVSEARRRILGAVPRLAAEVVPVSAAVGRVLAEDVTARVSQPPADVSSMDGYAVRAADVAEVPATLRIVDRVPAGAAASVSLGAGEAIRIFTGAPVPAGADAVVIQENAVADGDRVTVTVPVSRGRFIRPAGLDFRAGEVQLRAGRRLTVRDVALAAATNHPWLRVARRPRVAILATGDEIVLPGEPIGANRIVSSNSIALAGLVAAAGGDAVNLGIAGDDATSLASLAAGARGTDLLVTTGGVSVGEHDLVKSALGTQGLETDFWKIAMRPGKPLLFGRLGDTPLLGLPGNPVSSMICGMIFLLPALDAMSGTGTDADPPDSARLGVDLDANDEREDYLRSALTLAPDGVATATPFGRQDSSMLSILGRADCLVVRPPHAEPAAAGTVVRIVRFPTGPIGV